MTFSGHIHSPYEEADARNWKKMTGSEKREVNMHLIIYVIVIHLLLIET